MTDKAALRRRITRMEQELPEEEILAGNLAITQKILALPEYHRAERIFVFYGVGREPDTRGILADALEHGKTVAIPYIVSDGVMEARVFTGFSDLVPGRFNIPTVGEKAACIRPQELDLLLVPGAAFDWEGRRLGRGGGYYDRFLPQCRGVRVGIVRDLALLDVVPTEAHDCRVEIIVTDKKNRETLKGSRDPLATLAAAVVAAAAAVVIAAAAGVTAAAAEQKNQDKYDPDARVAAKTISTHNKLQSAAVRRRIKFFMKLCRTLCRTDAGNLSFRYRTAVLWPSAVFYAAAWEGVTTAF